MCRRASILSRCRSRRHNFSVSGTALHKSNSSHLLHGHAGIEQYGKVSELVRQLLAEHGHADGDAGDDGLGEGGADGEAVDEVVHAVAEDDHPGERAFNSHISDLDLRFGILSFGILIRKLGFKY